MFCFVERRWGGSRNSQKSARKLAAGAAAGVTGRTRVHSYCQLVTVLASCSVDRNRSEEETERADRHKRNLIKKNHLKSKNHHLRHTQKGSWIKNMTNTALFL